jgi:hypothetical protein
MCSDHGFGKSKETKEFAEINCAISGLINQGISVRGSSTDKSDIKSLEGPSVLGPNEQRASVSELVQGTKLVSSVLGFTVSSRTQVQ